MAAKAGQIDIQSDIVRLRRWPVLQHLQCPESPVKICVCFDENRYMVLSNLPKPVFKPEVQETVLPSQAAPQLVKSLQ